MLPKTLKFWLIIALLLSLVYLIHNRLIDNLNTNNELVEGNPLQESTQTPVIQWKGYEINPVARYEIRARVLSTKRYFFGREADLSPVDFVLGWGPMSDNAVTSKLDISQSHRWYHYRWNDPPPINPAMIVRSSANTHLIPADDEIKACLLRVRRGEIITLKGYLVNIKHPDGWKWRTSMLREDSGEGACEVMWVSEVKVY